MLQPPRLDRSLGAQAAAAAAHVPAHACCRGHRVQANRAAIREVYYLNAEYETRGNMLNKAGRAAGIDPRSLFTGSGARA